MGTVVHLSNVRLSFPKLIEPEAAKGTPNAEKKFGCDLILPHGDQQFATFMGEVGKVATEKWKEHANAVLQLCQSDRKMRCFGSGSEKIDKKTFKPYVGYDGGVYISASSPEDKPPVMVDANGTPCPNENTMLRKELARKLYGGCYVNVAIRVWPQDNSFGRAIRCELVGVQFAKDGDAFGEAPPDLTSMFGAVQSAGAPAGDNKPAWM
jgi:Protein of unknown function (DUF2815)